MLNIVVGVCERLTRDAYASVQLVEGAFPAGILLRRSFSHLLSASHIPRPRTSLISDLKQGSKVSLALRQGGKFIDLFKPLPENLRDIRVNCVSK